MNIIVGKNSRLSLALKVQLEINNNVTLLETRNALKDINQFDPMSVSKIFCVGAITDPDFYEADIKKVNFYLPVELRKKFPQCQLITFGTVLEETRMDNPYVNSKRTLQKYLATDGGNSIHFRLNTLYGIGKPKKHMFLGQLYEAIKNQKEFSMSSGEQYREYHHYDDVVQVILTKINTKNTSSEINVNSGTPVQLLDLANFIIKYLDIKIEILCEKTTFPDEVYNKFFTTEKLANDFRESKLGVASYMKNLIEENI